MDYKTSLTTYRKKVLKYQKMIQDLKNNLSHGIITLEGVLSEVIEKTWTEKKSKRYKILSTNFSDFVDYPPDFIKGIFKFYNIDDLEPCFFIDTFKISQTLEVGKKYRIKVKFNNYHKFYIDEMLVIENI